MRGTLEFEDEDELIAALRGAAWMEVAETTYSHIKELLSYEGSEMEEKTIKVLKGLKEIMDDEMRRQGISLE